MSRPGETPPIQRPEIGTEPRVFPFLRQYASIQRIIDTGRGYAANVLGQPGTVYRLGESTTGDFMQPSSVVLTNYPAIRKVMRGGLAMESHEDMGLVYYNIVSDLNYMLSGDVWYQTDPYYGEGDTLVDYTTEEFVGFCLANHPVAKQAVAVQVHRFAHIFRPQAGVDPNGYAQTYQQDAYGLGISGGTAVFIAPSGMSVNTLTEDNIIAGGALAWIPIGLQPVSRAKGAQLRPYVPGLTDQTEYFCYTPPIPGYEPVEGDIYQTLNGSRYVVEIPWHLESGIVGNSMLLRRVNAQVANSGPV